MKEEFFIVTKWHNEPHDYNKAHLPLAIGEGNTNPFLSNAFVGFLTYEEANDFATFLNKKFGDGKLAFSTMSFWAQP